MSMRQPLVIWAQRESFIFVTIEVDEAKVEVLEADTNKLHFRGSSKTDIFETTLEFFDEIKGEELKRSESNTRVVELTIPKKENKWWPRLLKEKGKVHWLKVDFSKWKDEDDSGAEDGLPGGDAGMGGFDINQYMNQMGGMGGEGGAGFDGLDDDEDDGDMPDLEDNEDEPESTKTA